MEKQVAFEHGGWILYAGHCTGLRADDLKIENTNNFEKFSIEIKLPNGKPYGPEGNRKYLFNVDDIEILHSSGSKICDVAHVEEYIAALDDAIEFVDRLVKYMIENDWVE